MPARFILGCPAWSMKASSQCKPWLHITAAAADEFLVTFYGPAQWGDNWRIGPYQSHKLQCQRCSLFHILLNSPLNSSMDSQAGAWHFPTVSSSQINGYCCLIGQFTHLLIWDIQFWGFWIYVASPYFTVYEGTYIKPYEFGLELP